MLHHHQRVFALEAQKQLGGALGFLVGHAGHWFIQQQQLGVLHQQHADLQPLLLAVAQVAGLPTHTVSQVDGVQDLCQPVPLGRVQLEEHGGFDALIRLQGQLQVLEHRELLKHRGLLELAPNAQLRDLGFFVAQQIDGAAKKHGAAVGPGFTGDDVHHRGLARAIGADDATQLAGRDIEAQAIDGFEAVKTHVHVFQVEDAPVGHIYLALAGQAAETSGPAAGLGLCGLPGQCG